MTKATLTSRLFAVALIVVGLAVGFWFFGPDDPAVTLTQFLRENLDHDAGSRALDSSGGDASSTGTNPGLLYGRVTTTDGESYEGRLRWGGNEEAVWGNYFNGRKEANPWADYVPDELLPKERLSIGAFGMEIGLWDTTIDLGRPFMVRFGDIARIDPRGREIRITLKSGAMYDLDRFEADDLADSVRVWDGAVGSVELGEWRIRTIEFLPSPDAGAGAPSGPAPLHGTVHTRQGDFTGLIQWEREECLGSDVLRGRTADGDISLRFDTIRSIARRAPDGALVTLRDGQEIVLSGTRAAGQSGRGTYVDDPRYGRVLVSWDALESIDFSPGGTGPGYDDFPPGRPLTGTVTTRSGGRFSGTLAYDLDESETTETLDAPWQGIDYTIPFGLIASIALPDPEARSATHATVSLHSGEQLRLELSGDLGELNLGMLIFVDDDGHPAYVPWADVEQIDLDQPPEMYPPNAAQ